MGNRFRRPKTISGSELSKAVNEAINANTNGKTLKANPIDSKDVDNLNQSEFEQYSNLGRRETLLASQIIDEKEELVFVTLLKKTPVQKMLKMSDLKTPYLKAIFHKDTQAALDHLESIRCNESKIDFERELIVAFWFSVHLERIQLSRHLLHQNVYIKQLVTLALHRDKGHSNNKDSCQLEDIDKSPSSNTSMLNRKFRQSNSGSTKNFGHIQGNTPGPSTFKKQVTIKIDPDNGPTEIRSVKPSIISDNSSSIGVVGTSGGILKKNSNIPSDNMMATDPLSWYQPNKDAQISDKRSDNLSAPPKIIQAAGKTSSSIGIRNSLISGPGAPPRSDPYSQRFDEEMRYEGGEREDLNEDYPQIQEDSGHESSGESKEDEELMRQRDNDHLIYLKSLGISKREIQSMDIKKREQLHILKNSFRLRYPQLMTNILRIILEKNEEKLACQIVAYYELSIDDDLMFFALENRFFLFLQFLWVFKKNFLGQRYNYDVDYNTGQDTYTPTQVVCITFTQLFDLIINVYSDMPKVSEQCIRNVCEWFVKSEDNFLLALLYHYQDAFALEFMGYYSQFLDKDLFLYSLNHGNRLFLQHALLMGAFDNMIFKNEEVINHMLVILKDGCRTNFLLNVLLLIDISIWKNKHLKDLLSIFEGYVEHSYESNYLLLSQNPLMSIALSAELLKFMASHRKRFENECKKSCQEILNLGKMFLSKVDDEKYFEQLLMDRDFKNRTILKIITENYFESLLHEEDPKGENLMVKLWHGQEASKCDGNIYGYSNLTHIFFTKAKKTSMGTPFFKLITNFFDVNFEQDYTFQYRYRTKSIAFFFMKEFLFALALLILFQLINYEYLTLFKTQPMYLAAANSEEALQSNFSTPTSMNPNVVFTIDISEYTYDFSSVNFDYQDIKDENLRKAKLSHNMQEYRGWELYLLILSGSLSMQIVLRGIFNVFTRKMKVQIDKWTLMDLLNSVLNIVAFEIVVNVPIYFIENVDTKYQLDYLMIAVLIISWLRFFIYFLIVREISKMLLTIYEMLTDTLSFIFIVVCYLLIVGSVFTTLYQDVNSDKFGGMALSLKTLYDGAMAVYDYKGMQDREFQFSVLQIVHIYFANILLMNFLIAILSFTYENMQQISVFKYKVNVYKYMERYLIAFQEETYSELIIHPPPVSLISILVLPLMAVKPWAASVNRFLSYFIFWAENIIFVGLFFLYECLLVPIVFGKTFFTLMFSNQGLFTTIFYCIIWIFSGILFDFGLVLYDVYYLIKILSMHQGCRHVTENQVELKQVSVDPAVKLKVYNEVRQTVIELFIELRKQALSVMGAKDEENEIFAAEGNFHDIDVLSMLEQSEDLIKDQGIFLLKYTVIQDEWRKRKVRADIINDRTKLFKEKQEELVREQSFMGPQGGPEASAKMKEQMAKASMPLSVGGDTNSEKTPKPILFKKVAVGLKDIIDLQMDRKSRKSSAVSNNETLGQNVKAQIIEQMLMKSRKNAKKGNENDKQLQQQQPSSIIQTSKSIVNNNFEDFDEAFQENQEEEDVFVDDKSGELLDDENQKVIQSKIEERLVDEFIRKFIVISEKSTLDHVDLILMLRALPNQIVDYNLEQNELFNFKVFQDSLIAFQNLDIVNAFEYYDQKNRERAQQIKDMLISQKSDLSQIHDIMIQVKDMIQINEDKFKDQQNSSTLNIPTTKDSNQLSVNAKYESTKLLNMNGVTGSLAASHLGASLRQLAKKNSRRNLFNV